MVMAQEVVVLVAILIAIPAAIFTGYQILELQGGPTITSFTASISDSNGDGVVNPGDNFAFSCSASDSNGLKYISVTQTYPTGGNGWWSPSTPNGYLDGSTTYTFTKNDVGSVLWTSGGKEGGVPGTYTFTCEVTNVNETKTKSQKTW